MPQVLNDAAVPRDVPHTIEKRNLSNGGVIGVTFTGVIVFCALIYVLFRWCHAREMENARRNPPSRVAIRAAQAWKQGPPPYSGHAMDPLPPQHGSGQQVSMDNLSSSTNTSAAQGEGGDKKLASPVVGSLPPPYAPMQNPLGDR